MTRAQNRLADETSPYLLQHAHNPVDWYPWGPEALARAKELDRPVFLSVGYSACHWCHVMERESFENEGIARLMNEGFVNVKVDREERPDLDEIYMKAVQAMTGSGGWPMSVFLTPDLEPFYGGTYFPPDRRFGRPGFGEILAAIRQNWETNRAALVEQGKRLVQAVTRETELARPAPLAVDLLDRSLAALAQSFDPEWGGFGGAPKFPHAMDVRIALRHWKRTKNPQALEMVTTTLRRMAGGGIHDHLGGGFARYSTDAEWLIPHFEKMLYDNALLVPAYVEAWLVTGDGIYEHTVRGVCRWILDEMVTPEGGLASSIDADSEGEEGRYYVWTPDQLEEVLGARTGAWAAEWFDVTDRGNFEHGTSVLSRQVPPADVARRLGVDSDELASAMEDARAELLRARAGREPPGKDDKVLASWNGLAISALARAWQVFGDDRWLDAARAAARYVLEEMRQPDGRLFATARGGRAHLNAYLDDYAFLIQGLLDLFESDFDEHWLREACALDEVLAERFEDDVHGGYFTTGEDHEELIARLKAPYDGALPSGNAVQALNLLRLAELTGDRPRAQRAERTIQSAGEMVNAMPHAFSQLLEAVDWLATGVREIVIAGRDEDPVTREMLRTVRTTFVPQRVVALARDGSDAQLVPLLQGREPPPRGAIAYVCRDYACRRPVESPEELATELAGTEIA